jgi:hypothetical protein
MEVLLHAQSSNFARPEGGTQTRATTKTKSGSAKAKKQLWRSSSRLLGVSSLRCVLPGESSLELVP